MSARICADICSLLQCPIFSKPKMSAKVCMKKNTKSEFYESFCGCPQAYLRRAAESAKRQPLLIQKNVYKSPQALTKARTFVDL